MPSLKRFKTGYSGIYYVIGRSLARADRSERIYYIRYRKNGKEVEEKAGRQFSDSMTPERAVTIRAECIEGKRLSRKEARNEARIRKDVQKSKERKEELDRLQIVETILNPNQGQKPFEETEEKFRIFVETASDLMCMIDKDGFFTYGNWAIAKTLGYSKEEIVGMHITQILPKKTLDNRFKKNFSQLKKGKLDLESTWMTKDGKEICGELRAVAFYDRQLKFAGAWGVLRDITERKLAEQALKEREAELDAKNISLEEMNAALRVLLKKRDDDKTELEEKVLLNIQELVLPYIEKIRNTGLDLRQRSFLNILESNLTDIATPFTRGLNSKYLKLTSAEIQIANLVKHGKTTKEIADVFGLSCKTIESHRRNIRKKLGIRNKKENLKTHLMNLYND